MGMKRKLLLTVLAVTLAGTLLLGLPGAAVQMGLGSGEPIQSQPMQPQPLQEDPLPGLFLKALAKQLGVTEERLKEALKAAKDEVIAERLEQAVRRGWLTLEQAERLRQRLSQAGPRELARLIFKLKGLKELKELKERFFGLRRGPFLGPEFERRWRPRIAYPPYPPIYGYNCVCYCNFPPPWDWPQPYAPEWPKPQPQPKWPYNKHHYWLKPKPQPKGE